MKRWAVMAAIGALALGGMAAGRAQTPPVAVPSGQPDVLVLVFQRPGQADLVDITYGSTVPHAQAQRDLAALAQATGWAMKSVRVTDGSAPVQHKMPMTGISFTAPGVVPNATGMLPVAQFVTAFRPYKRLALIFSAGPGFAFQGPHDFADGNVQVAMQQQGGGFVYQVRVLNPQLTRLSLPRTQGAAAAPRRAAPWVLLLAVLAAAGAAGVLVYVLMARKTPPPPGADTDALAEERTKIGTRG